MRIFGPLEAPAYYTSDLRSDRINLIMGGRAARYHELKSRRVVHVKGLF